MPETFEPFTWKDGPSGGTPVTAAQVNRIETGLESMDDRTAALELGLLTPVTITYATTIAPDATTGAYFRCAATGNLTLTDPTGGTNGQTILVEIEASGADRVLSVAGSTISIPSGQVWAGLLRYSTTKGWLLNDSAGGGGSGISPTLIDAKGDLIVGTAADVAARLPVGTDGQVLTASSAAATGLAWAAAGAGGGAVTQNFQTGTAYTLALADLAGIVEMNNAAANTVTVPPTSSVNFPAGWWTTVRQWGAGQTSIAQGAGVTINAYGGGLKLAGRYAEATLTHRGTNVWSLSGETAV